MLLGRGETGKQREKCNALDCCCCEGFDPKSETNVTVLISECVGRVQIISRVPNQNGVSLLYIMLEIHHSGQEP